MSQNYELMHDKTLSYMHIEVDCATRDFCRVRMPLEANHLNAFGMAHGGLVCALADAAFGIAANAGSDHPVVTMSLAIDFLRPGKKSPLTAEARLIREGGHVINYDVKVLDAEKRVIATAIVSGYITEAPLPTPGDKNKIAAKK